MSVWLVVLSAKEIDFRLEAPGTDGEILMLCAAATDALST